MDYLESNKVVHKDLSLRNMLVSKRGTVLTVKISDFGLSRRLESNYYTATTDFTVAYRYDV